MPKAMTIAAGFKCRDGVILCADSQITLDQGKKYQAKIFGINKRAGMYLVYSGDVLFARELVDALQGAMKEQIGKSALNEVRRIYKQFHHKHYTQPPKAEKSFASILITARERDQMLLYYASGRHFVPVDTYEPPAGC
jgi:20S proteasome alpha/beta subunit